MAVIHSDEDLNVLKQIILKYEDICGQLHEKIDEKQVIHIYNLYDCLSFILAKTKQHIELNRIQEPFATSRHAYTNRLFATMENMPVTSAHPEVLYFLFFDTNRSIDTVSLDVAMRIRNYTDSEKNMVVRKLKWFVDVERLYLQQKDNLKKITTELDGNTVNRYYITLQSGELYEVKQKETEGSMLSI
jgi:hypothetical protein